MAKKQTFSDKIAKAKKAGQHEGDEIIQSVKVRSFIHKDGELKVETRMAKVSKANEKEIFG